MTNGKALPTFLQSSPYLSNPTRDGNPLSKSESQESGNQGRRTTKFADVVALISTNKTKLSNENNAAKVNHVQESHLSNIFDGVKKNSNTNQESVVSQDREDMIQHQPRNISTAVSMKSHCTSSPGSMDCNPLSSKYNHHSLMSSSTTTISSMTDRQKRLLTRTILHPDEIDLILTSFKQLPSENAASTVSDACEDIKHDGSCRVSESNCDHDDDLSVSSTDVKAWLAEF